MFAHSAVLVFDLDPLGESDYICGSTHIPPGKTALFSHSFMLMSKAGI